MNAFFKRGGLLALAALASLLLPAGLRAETRLEVGYIPILPMTHLFVMEGEGWTGEAGLELELTRFSSGPAIVQALGSGQLDVVYFGIGPAMVARAKGIPIKVVAANVVEQIALIARGALAAAFESTTSPEAAFAAFEETTGRKPSVASLPKGSVPDVVFRYWLAKVAGLPEDAVDLKGMGASQVQQALLASSVDAASILEPILTIVEQRVPDARVIVRGDEMLPNQPGAVVAVREELLETDRAAVLKLVELHLRATELIEQDPDLAAEHVHAFVGKGLVPVDLLQQAMRSPSSNFVADPNAIIEATRTMHDFQLEAGIIAQPVPLDELFDTSLFDEVKGGG